MKIAVIDMGTNSLHMQIVQVHADGSFEVLGREKDFTRLGDGSFQDGRLKEAPMRRAVGVMSRFAKIAANRGVRKILAFATSAVREAANGPDLIQQIAKKTGINVRVVTGKEEARLIYRAVQESILDSPSGYWSIDIGGGSVELNAGKDHGLMFSDSLKLGVARLRDLYLREDPPSKKQWDKLRKAVRKTLKKSLAHASRGTIPASMLIGTSGTIQNLAQMAHRLHHEEPLLRMNGAVLQQADLKDITRLLLNTEARQRAKIPGIDPTRQDQLLGGCAILLECMEALGVSKLTVCDKGIREGFVLDFIDRNRSRLKDEELIRDLRLRSVVALARRFEYDANHARQVAKLALTLFDQTRTLHKLKTEDRSLLEYGALLHDIGYHVSYPKHHKHAYYLIMNCGLDGFTPQDVEIVANIVRYHRKSFPKQTHPNFARLMPPAKDRVRKLAALLRLAEGLDRGHAQLVKSLQCRKNGKSVILKLHTREDPELEIWGVRQKLDLFGQVFRKPLVVRCWVRGKERAL